MKRAENKIIPMDNSRMPRIGMITDSGNFQLVKKIETLDELYDTLTRFKTIFARHKIYPSAFIYSWQIRTAKEWMDKGLFYSVIRVKKIKGIK